MELIVEIMPKRKSSIGKSTFDAKRMKVIRNNETLNEYETRIVSIRNNAQQLRSNETVLNRENRLENMRHNSKRARVNETVASREVRVSEVRNGAVIRRQTQWADLKCAAFHYDSCIDYRCVNFATFYSLYFVNS